MSSYTDYGDRYIENIACKPAVLALGKDPDVDKVICEKCPFPFCVRHEARQLKNLARDCMIMAMVSMNASMHVIVAKAGISARAVRAVKHAHISDSNVCYWCILNAKLEDVFCRSRTCTVAWDGDSVAVVLSTHKEATFSETKLVDAVVETLFPAGVIQHNGNAEHDHWTIENVGKGEASAVYNRMEELSKFTPNLR